MGQTDLRYLKSLSNQYPTIATAATEIINLQAILSLPKATEHFITDVHGEYDQFLHVLKNGSGAIKRKIEDEFGNAFRRFPENSRFIKSEDILYEIKKYSKDRFFLMVCNMII